MAILAQIFEGAWGRPNLKNGYSPLPNKRGGGGTFWAKIMPMIFTVIYGASREVNIQSGVRLINVKLRFTKFVLLFIKSGRSNKGL